MKPSPNFLPCQDEGRDKVSNEATNCNAALCHAFQPKAEFGDLKIVSFFVDRTIQNVRGIIFHPHRRVVHDGDGDDG